MTLEQLKELQVSRATGRKFLLLLADQLDRINEDNFDYSMWIGADWDGTRSILECGTTACALGWATTIPEIQQASGLCLTAKPFKHISIPGFEHDPYFDTLAAAEIAFGLTRDEAHYLFVPSEGRHPLKDPHGQLPPAPRSTASAKAVACHIRAFVNAHMKEAQS